MLSTKMQKALNDQINAELASAYIYLAMEAYFQTRDLGGFANWMDVQVKEELFHAKKLFDFIVDRDGQNELGALKAPAASWDSPLAAFEAAHKHELYITKRIHDLVELARKEKDTATESFLQWYVTEQVEEEKNTKAVVRQLRLVGSSGPGLFMLDRELATRTFTPPPPAA